MEFSAIDEVENLKKDESIEDKGEMSGVSSSVLEDSFIIWITVGVERSSTSDGSSNNSIVPFVFGMTCKNGRIVGICGFRDEVFS